MTRVTGPPTQPYLPVVDPVGLTGSPATGRKKLSKTIKKQMNNSYFAHFGKTQNSMHTSQKQIEFDAKFAKKVKQTEEHEQISPIRNSSSKNASITKCHNLRK